MESLGLDELIPTKQSYYKHQLIVHFLLRSPEIDRLLVTHAAGTGKSGTFFGASQYAKDEWFDHLGDKLNQPITRRALILASGQAQVDDLKRMVVCTFSNGEYLVNDPDLTLRSQKIRVNNKLKKWYDISRYRIFASRLVSGAQEEKITVIEYIRRHYAGYLIYIDEIQNLRVKPASLVALLDRMRLPGYTGLTLSETDFTKEENSEAPLEEPDEEEVADKRGIKKIKAIEAILNVADYAPNVKIVIGSATVIVKDNDDYKTPGIMILKGDQLRRELLAEDLSTITEERFNRYVVNRVSHVESTVGKWVKIEEGEEHDLNLESGRRVNLTLYPTLMSHFQSRFYLNNYNQSDGNHDIYIKAKQSAIFVYPDGSTGNEAFDRFIVRTNTGQYEFGPELNALFDMNNNKDAARKNLYKFSSLYYKVCEMIGFKDVEDKDQIKSGALFTDEKGRGVGVIAIYNEYYRGVGIILIGLLLSRFTGHEQFSENGRIIESATGGGYCTTASSSIVSSFEKKKRYAIVHSSTSLSVLNNAKTIFKSNNNVNGEYIRIALLPREAREGVSINNAVAFIRIGREWNPADDYQAERRVFRENSSDYLVNLIKSIPNRYLEEKYLQDGALKIRVFNMVSIPPMPGVFGSNGELIGTIINNQLLNINKQVIGTIVNGQVINANNQVVRRIQEQLIDDDNRIVGNIVNGNLLDNNNQLIGRIAEDQFLTPTGQLIGLISDSKVVTLDGRSIGTIINELLDVNGQFLGNIVNDVPDWDHSIDVAIYGSSIDRDMSSARIRRFLKRAAVDCYLNKDRNTLPAYMDNKSECDYDKCDYGCYNGPLTLGPVNMINYNNMFYDENSDAIGQAIIGMFNSAGTTDMTIRDVIRAVQQQLGMETHIIIPILRSIQDLIKYQYSFSNQFGYNIKLMLENDRLYLSNGTANNTYYTHNLYAQQLGLSESLERYRRARRDESMKIFIGHMGIITKEDFYSLEGFREYGYQNIQNAPNEYESNINIRAIREILYHPTTDKVNIVEWALREYFAPEYYKNRNYIIEYVLYITRNHWILSPYPDNAIDIASQDRPANTRGRKPQGTIAKNFKFGNGDILFNTNINNWIIHDMMAFKVGAAARLTPFTNATGPFRTLKIDTGKEESWIKYSEEDTDLIYYMAYREAFVRAKTRVIFDFNNKLLIHGQPQPIYLVILGDKLMLIDTGRGGSLDEPDKKVTKKSTSSSMFRIGAGKDAVKAESAKNAYNVMKPYIGDIEFDQFLKDYNKKNIYNPLVNSLKASDIILYL